MTNDFAPFALNVHRRFNELAKLGELFVVDVPKDGLWDLYLGTFPDGTNPIFRTNTEHDCSCCRNFVKNIGNVVAISGNKVLTVWDNFTELEEPYQSVARALSLVVSGAKIQSVFRSTEPSYGAEHTIERFNEPLVSGAISTIKWGHFHTGQLTPYFYAKTNAAQQRGTYNTNRATLGRAMEELTSKAIGEVLSLIESNALYRGEEHQRAVVSFNEMKSKYEKAANKELFLWANANHGAAHFRNTAIGTLVVDLSNDVPLEDAVRMFESKVAPTNYKRTTALITPRMVEDAAKTITELGLEPSLKRRFAKLSDVSINNVLWVDNDTRNGMQDGIAGLLAGETKRAKAKPKAPAANVDTISMEDFLADVVPSAQSIELLVKNEHAGNFMALTAPEDVDAPGLFQWDNNFAWSYTGNVADSIRERVKKAGGNVDAPLRFSLSWFNADDLDLHVQAPGQGHIYFGSKQGILDVDTNGGGPQNHIDPVENASFAARVTANGMYHVYVHQFRKAASSNGGFDFEIFTNGALRFFSYKKNLGPKEEVVIGTFMVKGGVITDWALNPALTEGSAGQSLWGVTTEDFVPVQTIMHSPNHWDDHAVGNKHWFFFLAGCKSDTPVRGIYNEFLKPELNVHRKVFEILGDKTKCAVADEQLAGLGFSSTQRANLSLRVRTGKTVRLFNISI